MTDIGRAGGTVDAGELEKFARMSAEWWDPEGKFKPLHRLHPLRLAYIRDHVAAHFGRQPNQPRPFAGLRIVDIGCGGGLLTEPMVRLGAETVGVDPGEANIEMARLHAAQGGLAVDYRATTAEAVAEAGETFDVVLAMEVIEHVADVEAFLATLSRLLRPGGLIFLSTINRNLKAYALAIVAAERVLRWLPPGTHDYAKLIRPSELEAALNEMGLRVEGRSGVTYNVLGDRWQLSSDMGVNYMLFALKPEAEPGAG
ncbi:3-demethylubiquinone-9 3-methyltransferase [Faunimonas pinastri]|uniref:Ubiquinone biosynthesis O-methyltransferase n=1 Tax=Faunimonas pinastri TaxID=1855383 RepID=A0A1H9LTI5_9HYPH|nr:bifunctional 2-polyprenyl-6-hydroxyphenol methylase/3-demethylubiquinol 3-O-methyltransferase UbiG [Faunimonas pinastri]SER14505.1 3-demethylubiquinone-9 3-methyltransferase [Faunimonas pinastri]